MSYLFAIAAFFVATLAVAALQAAVASFGGYTGRVLTRTPPWTWLWANGIWVVGLAAAYSAYAR